MKDEFKNIERTLVPYDQGEIETLLKQMMLKNGIKDVLYEGSNISQIASVISYAISTLNVNTAINLQETILPLATKRMNILMGARQLGYEPTAIKSYKYKVFLKPTFDMSILVKEDPTADPHDPLTKWIPDLMDDKVVHTFVLKTNTKFKNNGKDYWYLGPSIKFAPKLGHKDSVGKEILGYTNADISKFNNKQLPDPHLMVTPVEVIEGNFIKSYENPGVLEFDATNYLDHGVSKVRQDYLVPYNNLEEDNGMTVYLSYVDNFGNIITDEKWERSKQILIDENLSYNKHKFVRMENIILGYPAVFFEYAGLGNGIRSKTQIKISV